MRLLIACEYSLRLSGRSPSIHAVWELLMRLASRLDDARRMLDIVHRQHTPASLPLVALATGSGDLLVFLVK